MTGQYIVQGIFCTGRDHLPAGVIAQLELVLYHPQCTNHCPERRAQPGTTLYGILGVILIGMAIFFFVETQKAIAIAVTSSPSTY